MSNAIPGFRVTATPDDEQRFSVTVGDRVIAAGLPYSEALKLAQRTKGSKTELER